MISIRKATMADFTKLFSLKLKAKGEERLINKTLKPIASVKEHYSTYLKRDLDSKYRAVFVACDNGKFVGFIVGRIYRSLKIAGYERRMSLGNLFVAPSHRKKGIAKKLVAKLTTWATKEGIKTITLSLYPQNTHLKVIYEKMGFDQFCITMHKKL